jgi:hypothetical protein
MVAISHFSVLILIKKIPICTISPVTRKSLSNSVITSPIFAGLLDKNQQTGRGFKVQSLRFKVGFLLRAKSS